MKQFKTVFNFELKGMLKNKTMIITTIVIAVISILITSIPSFMLLFGKDVDTPDDEIVEVDESFTLVYASDDLEELYAPQLGEASYETEAGLREAVLKEEIPSGFVLNAPLDYTYISYDRSIFSEEQMIFESQLSMINQKQMFDQENIDMEKVYGIINTEINSELITIGKDASSGIVIAFGVLFIMYMLILLYGTNVATSVAREKDSRTMELLITATKPRILILGKVFAAGVMGILQVGVILLAVGLGFLLSKGNYPPEIMNLLQGSLTFDTLIVYILFSVSGYILYLFIFASLGSLVSKVEDVSSAVAPITYLFILAYLAASLAMQMPDSLMTRVTSYIPFVSIFTMPIRYMLTSVKLGSVLLSGAIMILTTVLIAALSIYIYRFGSLNYGNRIKLKDVVKSLKR